MCVHKRFIQVHAQTFLYKYMQCTYIYTCAYIYVSKCRNEMLVILMSYTILLESILAVAFIKQGYGWV